MCGNPWRAVMDVVIWLRGLGLGKYEVVFRENEINERVLPSLTAEDGLGAPEVLELVLANWYLAVVAPVAAIAYHSRLSWDGPPLAACDCWQAERFLCCLH